MNSTRRWVIGAAVTAAVVIALVFAGRRAAAPAGTADPNYAPNVGAVATGVSQAETMMAGSVIYVDGAVSNRGRRAVTQVLARLRFFDSLGQLVQTESSPLLAPAAGPLAPGQTRPFRLGFDHVSAQWNDAPPRIEIAQVFVR